MGKIIDSPDLIETADRIRLARQKAGFTQEALADEMGVSSNTVHRMENAQAAISIDKLFQIADILRVPVQTLCPSRFACVERSGVTSGLPEAYERLNEANKRVVADTVTALVSSLLVQQSVI